MVKIANDKMTGHALRHSFVRQFDLVRLAIKNVKAACDTVKVILLC